MKNWNILNKTLKRKEDIIEILLENRGLLNSEEKKLFLNPPPLNQILKGLPEDFKISLKEAKDKTLDVVKSNLPIIIHGDYDADGICATAILYNVIKKELGYEGCFAFIPNRFDHGYGLSKASIEYVFKKCGKEGGLLITVDSGITAVSEVEYAKSLGLDVIITDHHQKPSNLPNADIIVWNDLLVASSISWILGRMLGSKDSSSLGLVALATVTDLQPLLCLNRSFVKEGLKVLNENPPLGIKKIIEVAGRSNSNGKISEITTYDLGWIIGPRLNATGRIEDAFDSLNLLIEDDEKEIGRIASKLNEINTQRQDKTLEMYELADSDSSGFFDSLEIPKVIFSVSKDYHEGIIGLVAAKMVQKYYRPCVVISLTERYGKGSVRSVSGVDIISLLRNFEDLFDTLGGHAMAAGFNIKKENIEILQSKFVALCNDSIDSSLLVPTLSVDLKIPIEFVNLRLLEEINKLKPFGIGNPEPVFLSENMGVEAYDLVGKDKNHLSLKLFSDRKTYKAIFFNGAEFKNKIKVGGKIDIVYSLKENRFNEGRYVDLLIKDLKEVY